MFSKVLVANRGEIAVRVMRTLKEMGIRSVAVYSSADEQALHTITADEAVCLGEPEPAQSYLNIDKIVQAAKQTGAQAIHPGYGFLSENPLFAERLAQEGLVFIGPSADSMRRLGDKTAARRLAIEHMVPVTPGMKEPSADIEVLKKAAEGAGYPVLIKASAGGGGKGMRVVRQPEDLAASAERAASEALSAFGDGSIYVEKYIERPRHVEIQILADIQGNAVHCFERECSIQRRHQKIIEETPSPVLDEKLRERMGAAAVSIVKASGYVNAGTVEFLLAPDRSFYFLEVNTRLQVEHPITEMVTGLDLVRHQLEIAAGQALPFKQADLFQRGHAIECRLYAEDAANGFMPSPGLVVFHKPPQMPNVRFDSGLYSGMEVPVYYDPILGKLIAYAETRPAAIARMVQALKECVVLGVRTSIEYLIDVLESEPFKRGETHTHFLEEHFSGWKPSEKTDALMALGALLELERPQVVSERSAAAPPGEAFPSPWQRLGKWDLGR